TPHKRYDSIGSAPADEARASLTRIRVTRHSYRGPELPVFSITKQAASIWLCEFADAPTAAQKRKRYNADRHTPALGDGFPDGRWLLYETGGLRPEVFVRSVPSEAGGLSGAPGEWKISTADGGNPALGQ